ncbi:PLPP1 isoform 6 [Pan troglodytes]|uniref:Phospholipid phosphatase 1 n=3 Tax=Hominidae TaxID=9604 RepID=D6REC3_HUMAN|nr:phospholipid phosphatase 1 [Homo sapiens]KAI4021280.1 phospholipid phosphatase 1 [Homo sapiens]PNI24055.1 PLPP1 isoform 6 [Pan troglodytes]PNJ52899.1 PLPP1 isoform 5 [Pongo abelii]
MFDKTRLPYVALDVLCVLLASMPMAVLKLGQIYPFQRGFFCKDNSINYPYHDSTVTSTVLILVGVGLPISSLDCLLQFLLQGIPPSNEEYSVMMSPSSTLTKKTPYLMRY